MVLHDSGATLTIQCDNRIVAARIVENNVMLSRKKCKLCHVIVAFGNAHPVLQLPKGVCVGLYVAVARKALGTQVSVRGLHMTGSNAGCASY